MSFLSLIGIEFKKIRRSKIMIIFVLAVIMLWLPSIINADLNFKMDDIGISPEHNMFIQGFMGMAWFMFPASMVVATVLLTQTERSNQGILKMLSLPVSTAQLCLAKFIVLIILGAIQMLMATAMYYICIAIASHTQNYDFFLSPWFVLKEVGIIWVVSIPMMAVFWLLSVWIRTPIFSVGIGLASIVPSVILIATKVWFAYPSCYPFFIIAVEYGKLATNFHAPEFSYFPWVPVAILITILCLTLSCLGYGRKERR